MVEFERLAETAGKLIARIHGGGIRKLDEALAASRTTSGTYRYTYDRYVQYFQERREQNLTEQDLFVGFAFAYSWMSSIKQLDTTSETVNAAVMALNTLHTSVPADLGETGYKTAIDPQAAERTVVLMEPVRYFLGSVIATSRLAHFVNPDVFPIWDAVIHRYCRPQDAPGGGDSLRTYVEYAQRVHQTVNHPDFEGRIYGPLVRTMAQAYQAIADHYRTPAPMGKLRAAEFVMFFGGRTEQLAVSNIR